MNLVRQDVGRTDMVPVEAGPTEIAEVDAQWGNARFSARAQATPFGLLAVGGLVTSILLGVSVMILSAGKVSRAARKSRKE